MKGQYLTPIGNVCELENVLINGAGTKLSLTKSGTVNLLNFMQDELNLFFRSFVQKI